MRFTALTFWVCNWNVRQRARGRQTHANETPTKRQRHPRRSQRHSGGPANGHVMQALQRAARRAAKSMSLDRASRPALSSQIGDRFCPGAASDWAMTRSVAAPVIALRGTVSGRAGLRGDRSRPRTRARRSLENCYRAGGSVSPSARQSESLRARGQLATEPRSTNVTFSAKRSNGLGAQNGRIASEGA